MHDTQLVSPNKRASGTENGTRYVARVTRFGSRQPSFDLLSLSLINRDRRTTYIFGRSTSPEGETIRRDNKNRRHAESTVVHFANWHDERVKYATQLDAHERCICLRDFLTPDALESHEKPCSQECEVECEAKAPGVSIRYYQRTSSLNINIFVNEGRGRSNWSTLTLLFFRCIEDN